MRCWARNAAASGWRWSPIRPRRSGWRSSCGRGEGADLLISEGMYGSEEDKPVRWETLHMTFAEAAALARDGGARRLWFTHFGPSMSDPSTHLGRARAVFPQTVVGYDGLTETLSFQD